MIATPIQRTKQRGAAAILLSLIILFGLIAVFTFRLERRQPELEAERKTALALAQAKEVLLGRAAVNDNPGTFPCPDADNDGDSAGAICPDRLGRFPYKTLKSDQLHDSEGETLWYIVDDAFWDNGPPMNTTVLPTLKVNGQAVIAAILAPRAALSGQNRFDTETPSTPANKPENYLESYVDPISVQPDSSSYNDRVLTITFDEVFSIVTFRMARELSLTAYSGSMGTTIESISKKPGVWVDNEWNDAVDGPPNTAGPSKVDGTTITLKFSGCDVTYTITAPGSVKRDRQSC